MSYIDTEPNTELNFEPNTKPDTDPSPERKPSFRRSSIQLDYRLSTYEERLALVQKTLDAYARAKKSLRQWDYDLLANYLLCGDDAQGTNPVREGYIQLEDGQTGYRPKEQSLEALLESPTFTEQKLNIGPIRYTTPKPKFDRQRYATDTSTSNARALNSTWKSIDHIDRLLRLRANYPIENPTEKELLAAYSLSPQNVYKLKKLLLELRREQYTLGDFVKPQIQLHSVLQSHYRGESETAPNPNWTFLPLGLRTPARETYFQKPYTLTLQDLNVEPETNSYVVDFRNWTHIYQLNEFREDLEQESIGDPESTVPYIYATLDFYAQYAHLRPAQQLVLQLKAQHYTNEFIARILQEKLGKSYAPAYISTIYTKQVCEGIAQAAQLHYETFLARGSIQLFKACKDCGEILLKDERNFAHSKRCTGGWSCRCKRCESEKRKITKPKPQEEKPK